jgi:16S rRNA processing protein RimM
MRPFGLKGEIYVKLYNQLSCTIFDRENLLLAFPQGEQRTVNVERWRRQGEKLVVSFQGCKNRNDAEELRGATLLVSRVDLPKIDDDEFYDIDLIDLMVVSASGETLGRIVGVEHPPSHDILVIKLNDGAFIDLPFVAEFIVKIDSANQTILIELPTGLPRRNWR